MQGNRDKRPLKLVRITAVLLLAITFGLVIPIPAYALKGQACNKFANHGWWRHYRFLGIVGKGKALSEGTKREGSTSLATDATSEHLTSTIDPGAWTREGISTSQSTSSWGACSLIALQELREERDHFIALNTDEIKRDSAFGAGQYLKTLAFYSLCDLEGTLELSRQMQKNIAQFIDSTPAELPSKFSAILQLSTLPNHCDLI